jgi:hypothetical protein
MFHVKNTSKKSYIFISLWRFPVTLFLLLRRIWNGIMIIEICHTYTTMFINIWFALGVCFFLQQILFQCFNSTMEAQVDKQFRKTMYSQPDNDTIDQYYFY